ncbi:sensor domain-containing diguanylate cyclase [Vogesella sp. DC21W]|uniref:diguanylate cyclase n=1 Tax=Vogesella aquatica TaxID=2984206 RepID=A0ABT5IZ31_9NEIS|nr:sensor domain-containing diguanylate cyclase [Vogesella aquatica]MDC7717836.1 sensor domain-containing diguanylate cyclase [Vogesella aquatica]
MPVYEALNALSTPVWIVSPQTEEALFANQVATVLAGGAGVSELRHGSLSARPQAKLADYTPAVLAREQVVEIWTFQRHGQAVSLPCRLTRLSMGEHAGAILVEALASGDAMLHGWPPAGQCLSSPGRDNEVRGFYEVLFRTNSAPMLLIDPEADGRILDANEAATRFYGYPREVFAGKHTWEINEAGRSILPVMQAVASLPGGHRPLSFVHRLADGSLRNVQTYAGPVVLDGRRLMLCVVHDITEQEQLKRELEQAALRDPLTGLWNRRHMMTQLEQALVGKRVQDTAFCLILLDVDHFKLVNDSYGHQAGDRMLVALAHTLASRLRESDTLCRWGGEEFLLLLPSSRQDSALQLADTLRQTVAAMTHDDLPSITISQGVVQHLPGESLHSLVSRVDAALYQAKHAGRNVVVTG